MASFPDVPVDIAREILECLACIGGPSRFNVSLVSRTVQQWTDPYVLDRIIIKHDDKWDQFTTMLFEENETERMKQALLNLRTLAVKPAVSGKLYLFSMEEVLQRFPHLEIIYISTGSCKIYQPHSNLRRIGAAFGTMWLRGIQNRDDLCLWSITHLDLSLMSPEEWPDLIHLGLPLLKTLTHMCCDLETPSTIGEVRDHLTVLTASLPSSLVLCLVNIHLEEIDTVELEGRYDVGFDDRILLCSQLDPEDQGCMEWVLAADLFNDFDEWDGAIEEKNTYWSKGLEMVKLRKLDNQ